MAVKKGLDPFAIEMVSAVSVFFKVVESAPKYEHVPIMRPLNMNGHYVPRFWQPVKYKCVYTLCIRTRSFINPGLKAPVLADAWQEECLPYTK
jgi:hypothetical protein